MIKQLSLLHAIKWSYSASWGERALGALITVVLAAALGPREFGMIAMGLVYISFAQMCLEQGFVAALIQRKNLLPLHLDTVFWMTLVLSIALMGITGILSPWWAAINHVPDVSKVIRVLSLSIVIEALSIVQVA
jgi:O-antigen/teichoic acid export membrane protein